MASPNPFIKHNDDILGKLFLTGNLLVILYEIIRFTCFK